MLSPGALMQRIVARLRGRAPPRLAVHATDSACPQAPKYRRSIGPPTSSCWLARFRFRCCWCRTRRLALAPIAASAYPTGASSLPGREGEREPTTPGRHAMAYSRDSKSAKVRTQLTHPVIDGDGHWL